MRTMECDVVVVGAGPAGSMTAKWAALGGAKVIMIEKRPEIGSPVRCGEGISRSWLGRVGIKVDPKWIARSVKGAKIVSPSGKHEVMLDESKAGNEVGFVLDRVFFDKALARDAAEAGVKIMLKTAATSLIKEKGEIVGVNAVSHGEPVEIRAGCVVGADGFESQVGRWGGIDTSLGATDIITCYQYRLTNLDYDPDFTEFRLGSVAPGGYAWIFPKDGNTANVGLGVLLTKLRKPGEVKRYLDKWIAEDPRLRDGQPLEAVCGAVSVCQPLDSVTADNLLLVGDAARMINPITGGGIANGCYAGMFAGKVLAKAAKTGDYSKEALQEYEDDWRDKLENSLWRDWMAKEKLIKLPDETLDKLTEAVSKVELDRITVGTLLAAVKQTHPELVKEFEDLI